MVKMIFLIYVSIGLMVGVITMIVPRLRRNFMIVARHTRNLVRSFYIEVFHASTEDVEDVEHSRFVEWYWNGGYLLGALFDFMIFWPHVARALYKVSKIIK